MIEIFIAIILIIFIGLFAALSFIGKDEVAKLNQEAQAESRTQQLQDS